MSFSYERYDRRSSGSRRTTFGYWVPLALTVTIATAGVAAWIWSERQDSDPDDDTDLSYGEAGPDNLRPPPAGGGVQYRRDDALSQSQGLDVRTEETFMSRMSGAIRRTPSPSQMFDIAGKKVVAGVAAAGAAVGSALQSIREERPDDFADHSRWSEEAARRGADNLAATGDRQVEAKAPIKPRPRTKRRTVVVVLSAEQTLDKLRDDDHTSYHSEYPSILSHLPQTNLDKTELIVLIYAPVKSRPASTNAPASLSSSYSAINLPGQTSSGDELTTVDPRPDATPALSATTFDTSIYRDIHAQARRLVESETNIMSFSTQTGHVHLLRHLVPDVVYMTENLAGERGANVEAVKNWVHQVVVVVGGDGANLGGLVDTEDEGDGKDEVIPEKWWQRGDLVGLGKGVEVVDASRLDEDFERRVGGRE